MKDLLEQLQHIYNEVKDKNEFAIINAYGYSAKRCTAAFTSKIFFRLSNTVTFLF